ncbi:MAG: hypothetical protein IJ410_03420 [Oscillospiraceae bacterium]|nr:hypothetical protein [Oscillospiraceae bacterium]
MKTEMMCTVCGSVFVGGPTSKFCPECKRLRKDMHRESSRIKERAKKALEERSVRRKHKTDSLAAAVRRLEAYNKRTGENLSYGQRVQREII